jgi:oxygen-independent coproporphyrinogen-3 oxidase
LAISDMKFLIDTVYENYKVAENPEITLEANPDDLTVVPVRAQSKILFEDYIAMGINRLSIGIQSFFDGDLKLMNRAHNANEAKACLAEATKYFDNISIDLIYGIPGLSNERWQKNIEAVLSLDIPHISSYALTVEPKTTLKKLIQTGKIAEPNDEVAQEQFQILVDLLQANGFIHYELSNFGKPNYFSKNNSAYWLGKKYLGIGPSAHSYNGVSRSWNVANNSLYLKSIQENQLPNEVEILSLNDRYNEYIMTGLRTIWGVDLNRIENEFGTTTVTYLKKQAQKFLDDGLLVIDHTILKTTAKGKFLTDGMASDLFLINLE